MTEIHLVRSLANFVFYKLSSQGVFDAADQLVEINRLTEKVKSSSFERRAANTIVVIGRHEDHRRAVGLLNEAALQLDTAKARHLHIHDHTVD